MKVLQQIDLIQRLDQLIRQKVTGNPKCLAEKLEISEATLYRVIESMKRMGAPLEFNTQLQSYVYSKDVNFRCGFFLRELSPNEMPDINGGFSHSDYFQDFGHIFLLDFKCSTPSFHDKVVYARAHGYTV